MAGVLDKFHEWCARQGHRIRGYNPWEIASETVRAAHEHRVIGLAAEMAFFASLALVPFTVAVGAALGYSSRLIGPDRVDDLESAAVHVMSIILSPGLMGDVVGPFVRAQFDRQEGGLAVVAIGGGLWLASRVFVPALYGLDLAYGVSESRSALVQRAIALLLAVASLIVVTVVVVMLVVGPLLGSARTLAFRFNLGAAFEVVWNVGRWPTAVLVLGIFMLLVYRYAPDAHMKWGTALPGAIVGVVLWLLLAVGFRLYLAYLASESGIGAAVPVQPSGDDPFTVASRMVGAIVATVLWTFLSSLALLTGGEVNAAIDRARQHRARQHRA